MQKYVRSYDEVKYVPVVCISLSLPRLLFLWTSPFRHRHFLLFLLLCSFWINSCDFLYLLIKFSTRSWSLRVVMNMLPRLRQTTVHFVLVLMRWWRWRRWHVGLRSSLRSRYLISRYSTAWHISPCGVSNQYTSSVSIPSRWAWTSAIFIGVYSWRNLSVSEHHFCLLSPSFFSFSLTIRLLFLLPFIFLS